MASTYLTKTFSGAGNTKKWTWSAWVKKSQESSSNTYNQVLFGTAGSSYDTIAFQTTPNNPKFFANISGDFERTTNALHTDCNGWYHLVVTFDSAQGTAADRLKLYVNGVQQSSFSDNTNGNQNDDSYINTTDAHQIGKQAGLSRYFDGVMSHVHFCDGYAYAASDFGETDSTTGEWKIKVPSVSYGTNGFFILKDGNTITDSSTNSNDWSLGGGTLTKTEDCPSNVFATWNPLIRSTQTLSNGNTTVTNGSGANWRVAGTTLGATSGKYYCEIKITEKGGGSQVGLMNLDELPASMATDIGSAEWSWSYYHTGNKRHNNSSTSYGATYTTGDIIGIAMDLDNNKLYFSKNGTWQDSGDPTSGSTGTGSAFDLDAGGTYAFAASSNDDGTDPIQSANFGNGYFGTTAVSSAGTNASNLGIFEYDVPTGYTALCTKGLNE